MNYCWKTLIKGFKKNTEILYSFLKMCFFFRSSVHHTKKISNMIDFGNDIILENILSKVARKINSESHTPRLFFNWHSKLSIQMKMRNNVVWYLRVYLGSYVCFSSFMDIWEMIQRKNCSFTKLYLGEYQFCACVLPSSLSNALSLIWGRYYSKLDNIVFG